MLETKRSRTRAQLINKAGELFQKNSILATSLNQVATAAGMSKGAIYSNFQSKDDLVLAVALAQDLTIKPNITPGMTISQILEAVGVATAALVNAADGKSKFIGEYLLYAAANEPLRAEVAALFSQRVRHLSAQLEALNFVGNLSARELVLACEALITGFVIQKSVMRSDIGDSEIIAAFTALIGK